MDIPAPAYAAMGAISAAMIAGGISFISTVLAKDQKTSEFRQAWIDGLRNDIADMISYFCVVTDSIRELVKAGKSKGEILVYMLGKDEHFRMLEMVDARIKLRINTSEHHKLLDTLLAIRNYPKSDKILDSKVADDLVAELVKESQLVLKFEWKRVKRGEPVFIATKVISLLVIFAALGLAVAYARGHFKFEFIT